MFDKNKYECDAAKWGHDHAQTDSRGRIAAPNTSYLQASKAKASLQKRKKENTCGAIRSRPSAVDRSTQSTDNIFRRKLGNSTRKSLCDKIQFSLDLQQYTDYFWPEGRGGARRLFAAQLLSEGASASSAFNRDAGQTSKAGGDHLLALRSAHA